MIHQGDCLEVLRTLPGGSVQCCVTSPPYWALRDYGVEGQYGLEATLEEYISRMVEVFGEVRRVLHGSGTLWLNLGDVYAHSGACGGGSALSNPTDGRNGDQSPRGRADDRVAQKKTRGVMPAGLKPKDLCMMPARVALALQADGWWLRSHICWAKKAPMPESCTDRPTTAWESIFLLAKSQRYYYDGEAVKQPLARPEEIGRKSPALFGGKHKANGYGTRKHSGNEYRPTEESSANLRNFWLLGPEPYAEAHFATFPTEIPRRCILAGTSERGCCPECLSPWERVVESEIDAYGRKQAIRDGKAAGGRDNDGKGAASWGALYPCGVKTSQTTGWRPTCHHTDDPIPCTVLDPFAGSGTRPCWWR